VEHPRFLLWRIPEPGPHIYHSTLLNLPGREVANVPPGDYAMPRAETMKEMGSPEFIEKMKRGPVMTMTVRPSGHPAMGKQLMLWFVFTIVVSVFAAYVAGRALGPGGDYLSVFRFAGVTAFAAYGIGGWGESIWWGRKWSCRI